MDVILIFYYLDDGDETLIGETLFFCDIINYHYMKSLIVKINNIETKGIIRKHQNINNNNI